MTLYCFSTVCVFMYYIFSSHNITRNRLKNDIKINNAHLSQKH